MIIAACQIHHQELLVTEMMLENLLTNLAPAEVAAALSCITFEQKNLPDVKFNENLESLK